MWVAFAAAVIFVLINLLLIQFSWNWGIVPAVSGAKEIDYQTAFWISVLVYLLSPSRSSKDE